MNRDVVLSDLAIADFDEAFQWYESHRSGLGLEFKDEIHSTFMRIRTDAEMFEIVHAGKRRALVKRFPYAVYFRMHENEAVVLAIMHTSRHAKVWKSRD